MSNEKMSTLRVHRFTDACPIELKTFFRYFRIIQNAFLHNNLQIDKNSKIIIHLTGLFNFWIEICVESIDFGISQGCRRPFDDHLKIKINYGVIKPIESIESLKIATSDWVIVCFDNGLQKMKIKTFMSELHRLVKTTYPFRLSKR